MHVIHRVVPGLALASLVVLALGCPQGPSQPPPGPDPIDEPLLTIPADAPTNASSCDERLGFARQAMDDVVAAANGSCTQDADCTTVFAETQCLGACQAPILTARLDDFRDAQQAIDERACTRYAEDGCAYATPACLAVEAVCQASRCTLTERSP